MVVGDVLLISMDEYRLGATSDVGTFPILFEYKNRIEIYDDADDVDLDAQFSAGCWQAACRVGRRGLSDMRIVRLRRAG